MGNRPKSHAPPSPGPYGASDRGSELSVLRALTFLSMRTSSSNSMSSLINGWGPTANGNLRKIGIDMVFFERNHHACMVGIWWVKSSPLTLNLNRHVVNPIINHPLEDQPFSGNLYIIPKGEIPTNRPRLQMFYYWVCPSSRFHPAIAYSQVAPTALARMGCFARSRKSQPAVIRLRADESTVMMSRKSRRLKFYVTLHHFTMFVHKGIYILIIFVTCGLSLPWSVEWVIWLSGLEVRLTGAPFHAFLCLIDHPGLRRPSRPSVPVPWIHNGKCLPQKPRSK